MFYSENGYGSGYYACIFLLVHTGLRIYYNVFVPLGPQCNRHALPTNRAFAEFTQFIWQLCFKIMTELCGEVLPKCLTLKS